MGYVLDTTAFNRLIDGKFDLAVLPEDAEFIATHVQIDEINRTQNEDRRGRLFLYFAKSIQKIVPTDSFVLGISRLGEANLGDGRFYSAIKSALDEKNHRKPNNLKDALIAEVAVLHGHILVTSDRDLKQVVEDLGGQVVYVP
jgi:hypothetical protein